MITTLAELNPGELIPIIAIAGGLAVGAISIIAGTIRRTTREREREQSRRELAAYVAEGSMSAEDAAKIMDAGPRDKKDD